VAIIAVLELPPRLSLRIQVRVESLYGTYTLSLCPLDFWANREITLPNVCKDRLMLAPSCRREQGRSGRGGSDRVGVAGEGQTE